MRIHPRVQIVRAAENELEAFCSELEKKHRLTEGEYLRVVGGTLGRLVASCAKYMIRSERHPDDPDKPGGLV